MPYRACPRCRDGLHGIEGHEAIVLDPPRGSGHPPGFRCAVCHTRWKRSYVGDGLFLWHPEATGDVTSTKRP